MINMLLTRRSIREFKSDLVSNEDIYDLLNAAMHAPSAGNEQAWQFIILKEKILNDYLAINSNSPKGSPVGILVCGDKELELYPGYSVQDCSAASQNLLLAAHSKGLGGVWSAIFQDNIEAIKKLLNLPEHVTPFSFIPIGYPLGKLPEVTRFDEAKVHYNLW